MKIRLFIIESQLAILKHHMGVFARFRDLSIVGFAHSGIEALKHFKSLSPTPHVVLCDLALPDMSGIELTKRIKALNPAIEILLFSKSQTEDAVLEAIHAGAAGYLIKDSCVKKIHEAIVDVHNGGTIIQPCLARRLLKRFSAPLFLTPIAQLGKNDKRVDDVKTTLTMRELECLQIIAKGLSNHEAAQVLKLSKATIRTHLEHIYQKLDVNNRVEAITEGIRQGIIEL